MKNIVRNFVAATVATAAFATAVTTVSAAPSPGSGPVPVVKIPLASWTVVAAKKGWLQEEYAKHGSKIQIVDPGTSALSGQEAALLDRGDLHFASRMMYPATVHKANGIDASIVWMSSRSDKYRTPVIALKDSPLQTLADLKGKTLGSSRVGCGWTSPFEALEKAGVPLDTNTRKGAVRYTNISSGTTNVSALLAGKIDATGTHIALTHFASLVTQGHVKVIGRSPDDGVYVNAAGRPSFFAMRAFAEKHPELVQSFLKVRQKAVAWIQQNPDEAANIIARETRVPVYIAKFQITDPSTFDFMDGEPNAEVAAGAIRTFQKWYKDHGDDILATRSLTDQQIDAFVDRRFFKGGSHSVYN